MNQGIDFRRFYAEKIAPTFLIIFAIHDQLKKMALNLVLFSKRMSMEIL